MYYFKKKNNKKKYKKIQNIITRNKQLELKNQLAITIMINNNSNNSKQLIKKN
jgi:hypothetical protein